MTFALDCCDREAISWETTTAGHSGDVVRDVMLAAVERRFGASLKASTTIEWLTDNGSGYIAANTAAHNLALAFEHYNETHPHSALKYRSPRAFRRLAVLST